MTLHLIQKAAPTAILMLRRHHILSSSWHQRLLSLTNTRAKRTHITLTKPYLSLRPLQIHYYHLSSTTHHHPSKTIEISEAQRRSAQLELEQISQSTDRLLSIHDSASITEANVNETRVALHYWSRRWYMHFHPGFGRVAKGSALSLESLSSPSNNNANTRTISDDTKSGDYGARRAEQLLDWSIGHNLIERGVFNLEGIRSPLEYDDEFGSSPNMTFAQIIDTYLLPCGYDGVGAFGGNYTHRDQMYLLTRDENQRHYATLAKHYTKNASYVRAVVDATRIMKKMRQVQDVSSEVKADTLSIKSELNVWSKRSMVLGATHEGGKTGGILAGNIVGGHIVDGSPVEMLRSLEEDAGLDNKFYTMHGCLAEMERILLRAEEEWNVTGDETITPSTDWYNHMLGAWARSDVKEAPERSKEMLKGMEACETHYKGSHPGDHVRKCWARPDIISYNSVLFCLAREASESRAKEALHLFEQLKERYKQSKQEHIRPDEVTYGSVLHALAQVGMAREAERILDTIEEEAEVLPSLTVYNTVLNALANSTERSAPRRAELLLDRMRSLYSSGENPEIEPDTVSLSTVMSCHARSKTREGAERAEELLNRSIESYVTNGNAKMKPDSIMFNCAILAWAYCSGTLRELRDESGKAIIPAERAEMLLHKLLEMRDNDTLQIAPMAQTYNLVLDSWAKSHRRDAAERALRLMREMPAAGVSPDECSYNSVLHAMSKQTDLIWVTKAEELFAELQALSNSGQMTISDMTYSVMMNVYGKSIDRDGPQKAVRILRDMKEKGVQPTVISYNSCIDAFARRGDFENAESLIDEMTQLSEEGRMDLRPTIHSYAALINAYANSNALDAVDRAEEVVGRVEELGFVVPNTILYNSLINTIVKSGAIDSSARADQVLKRMELTRQSGNLEVSPDSFAYSMVLTLCARSKEPDAAVRASKILDTMEQLYSQGRTNVIANSRCYSAVITAWARSGSPDTLKHALNLIDRMEQNKQNNSPHGAPNAHCYNAVIHAIAKSSKSDKVQHCLDILHRMNEAKTTGDIDSAPTMVTYSTIVNACAYATGDKLQRKKAFELARTCLQTSLASTDLEPDESMFANFLLVVTRHLGVGEARDQLAEVVFREACSRGKVDRNVLSRFQTASPSAAGRLLPSLESDGIPVEWGMHIGKFKKKSYKR